MTQWATYIIMGETDKTSSRRKGAAISPRPFFSLRNMLVSLVGGLLVQLGLQRSRYEL